MHDRVDPRTSVVHPGAQDAFAFEAGFFGQSSRGDIPDHHPELKPSETQFLKSPAADELERSLAYPAPAMAGKDEVPNVSDRAVDCHSDGSHRASACPLGDGEAERPTVLPTVVRKREKFTRVLLAIRRWDARYPANDLGIGTGDHAVFDVALIPAPKRYDIVFEPRRGVTHQAIVVIAGKKRAAHATLKELAVTYSPRKLPPKYHRRERA